MINSFFIPLVITLAHGKEKPQQAPAASVPGTGLPGHLLFVECHSARGLIKLYGQTEYFVELGDLVF